MTRSDDPMVAVRQYVNAFNGGDSEAMAAICTDPMQILDGCRRMYGRAQQRTKTGGRTCSPRAST